MQAIHDSAERNDDFRSVRGPLTRGQISDLADDLGFVDPKDVSENRLGALFGGTRDLASRILAARRLLEQSAKQVAEFITSAADSSDPQVMTDFAQAVIRHDMIQSTVAGVTAEWGRAGQAFRSLSEWDGAGNINKLLKENTGRDLYQLKQIAKLGKNLDSPGKISKFLRDAGNRSIGRMILEYWVNGLISGVATHVTYVLGGQVFLAHQMGPETLAAALIGRLREAGGREGERIFAGEVGAKFGEYFRSLPKSAQAAVEGARTGQTTLLPGEKGHPLTPFQGDDAIRIARTIGNEDVRWSEAQADLFGMVRGIRDGMLATGKLLVSGEPDAPLVGLRYSPLGQIPDVTIRGANVLPVGSIARVPSRNVAMLHSFLHTTAYSVEKNAIAYRQATQEMRAGTLTQDAFTQRVGELRQSSDESQMEAARKIADQVSLVDRGGALTDVISRVTNWAPVLPLLGETPLLKFVDPFVRIASSIIDKSIMQRTPVGLVFSKELRADVAGRNGNVAQDTAMARMLLGSVMSIGFGTLAAEGLVSGSGPKDRDKAAMWRLAGNQAHSVRIGDVWYDMHRLGPLGMLLGIAADLHDVAGSISQGDVSTAASTLLHAVAQNVLDESFMRGPAEIIQAIEDPERYGPRYIQGQLSSFLPYSVMLGQMDRATDPYSRQARTVMDAIRQKIPGLSETLFPRRDVWGEPLPNLEAVGASGLTAVYEKRVSSDPVNLAMLRLAMGPAPMPRTIRNVKLTDQQYDDFARVAGRTAKMRLDQYVRSPDWQTWPPHTQRYVIETTIKMARESARGYMFMKYPQIPHDAVQLKQAKFQD